MELSNSTRRQYMLDLYITTLGIPWVLRTDL